MYNILTFENGQPIILYREKEKVFMYVASRGKIFSKGILFNNVKSDFKIFKSNNYMIFYLSSDNKLKLSQLKGQRFIEFLSIPLKDNSNNTIIEAFSPVFAFGELYIFYMLHNLSDSTFSLYCQKSSTTDKFILLKSKDSALKGFSSFADDKKIYIIVDYHQNTQIYSLDSAFNLTNHTDLEKSFRKIKEENAKNIEEIKNLQSLNKNISIQYDELVDYVKKLEEKCANPLLQRYNTQEIT